MPRIFLLHCMKALTRITTTVSSGFMLSLAGAYHAFAQNNVFGQIPSVTGDVGDGETTIRETVLRILQAVLSLMALAATVVIVVAGIRLVIGGQDDAQREKARNMILWAIVGLVVILLAQTIVAFVAEEFVASN